MDFDSIIKTFKEIAAFIADLFAKVKEFAAGFNKHYDFETDAAE